MPMSSSIPLMPHAVCWAAAPGLIWTMVVTNFITFLSYLSICLTLLYLARQTGRVIARDWAWFLVGFALFIVACGSTHLLEVITTWDPVFWVDAGTNIVTAILSAYVAVQLIRRAAKISFGVNDYAQRLLGAEAEKRRMEDSLLAAQKLEDWSRMSAVVAHEINSPLDAIQGLLYLITSDPSTSKEIADLAQTAADETSRVMTITRSTLSFFRHSVNPEKIDLKAAAESVRFVLESIARGRNVEITIETEGDPVVEAYPGETRQVLLNLVRNACEAISRPGGTVAIHLSGRPEGVEAIIEDSGEGIAPEILTRLFEFGASTKGERGNGMGLWTVKQIIDRHSGSIRVESQVGAGTRFTVFWPRVYQERASERLVLAETA
jgi:signal transduction histidine kinase